MCTTCARHVYGTCPLPLSSVIPFYACPAALFPVGFCLGVCLTLPNTIPDAILGDIIDYNELRTGTRSEILYTIT